MKKKLSILCNVCLVLIILTFACQLPGSSESVADQNEHNQLVADIAVIESVELDNLQEYYEQNKEWIEDVNIRLENYLAKIPANQKNSKLVELRGDNMNTRSLSDYFTWHTYHWRGNYWTYSMTPKMSTRILRAYCQAGWNELSAYYYGIRYDNGSLSNQYWCHFEAFIESGWDIEVGRPNVGLWQTILALCNPS